ncbi:hypothetical protein CXB51_008176 [Gossypium anomalum]|uniref:Integrase catalytic domain-containing protein n=1 Tax=Gossypium anomalum TaxID=47600 RepID=A0A8J5YZN6_9ROSI|nr:hypothetical protein CXB51_008176 [Gossypium anomalum]
MTKSPFTGKSERASDLLGLIHSDVYRPINTQARGGFHYFITFTDDFSRYGYVYLMHHKSEALEKFKEFKNEVQNQLGKTIKTLRSDRGGEYLSLEFDDFLKEYGIVSQLTPPAIFTLNRVPSKSVQKMPYEMWTGKRLKIEQQQIPQEIEEQVTTVETQPPHRSLRERHAPERYGFLITMHGDILLIDQDEPRTYQEAVASLGSEKWLEAMRSEMDSMYENQVWTLADPSERVKPIGCKWVFKKKMDMDGNIDVKKAFLNGKLEEDVYMTQPEGFINPKDAGKIYEPCVYKKVSGSTITFLDLGKATYILGVKIYRDKVLRRFNMEESKRGLLPMRHGISLSKEMCPSTPQERERMSKIPYASAIGSIMYAMLCTHPDVSYALSMTSRYQVDLDEGHWTTVKNILKYLRRTKDTFLIYGSEEELSVKGYTDASFQTNKDDSRSQSGFVFYLNGGAVSWKSSKQSTVADSTTEAEYIAASEATKEAVWIKKFITELGVVPSISDTIELRCDNNGAIAQAKEPRSH